MGRKQLTPELLASRLQSRVEYSEDHLLAMALEAVGQLDCDPSDVSTVITANYYSLGGPTLAHRLVDELGLDPATDKYHVLGVGCASAVPLFKLASQALFEKPESRALVIGAESITGFLTTVDPDDEKTKIVGSSLFGDGCAAAVLTRDAAATGPALLAAKVHQVEDTLGSVRFRVSADDSFMHMGRELPTIAREGAAKLVDDFLADHGNMGTASAFYVLKRVTTRNEPKPRRARADAHHRPRRHRRPHAAALVTVSRTPANIPPP